MTTLRVIMLRGATLISRLVTALPANAIYQYTPHLGLKENRNQCSAGWSGVAESAESKLVVLSMLSTRASSTCD